MSPDEQEAESRKHSSDGVMMLALSSGKIAVFNRAFQLDRIIDPENTSSGVPLLFEILKSVKPVEQRTPILPTTGVIKFIQSGDLDI